MGHRHLFSTSSMPEMDRDQIRNNFNPEPHLCLESGSFTLPLENVAINGANSVPYFNLTLRSNDYPSSSSSSEIPHYRSPTSGTSNPYQHPSTADSSSLIPSNYAQQGPSCYNRCTIYRGEGSNGNPQMGSGRGLFKRKSPTVSMVYDEGSTSRYYNGGSSSDLSVYSDHLHQKPMSSSQCWPSSPNSMVPDYSRDNILVAGEGFHRNVRSRNTHTFHLEANLAGIHSSCNLPCHFRPTGNFPAPSTHGQLSYNPLSIVSYGRTPSSDAAGFNHEINQTFVRSSTSSVPLEFGRGYHHNLIQSRNLGAPLPILHDPSRGMGAGPNSYGQSIGPHRSMTCHPAIGYATTSLEDGGQLGPEAFSGHSRPLSINGGRSSERNGRPRNSYGRFQSYSNEGNALGRWISEGVVMDRSPFYDSRNLFDHHQDMRLDIDNMSYEDLLSLEERIGNVNTGLSEDMISKCLTESTYCSSDQIQEDHDEGNCAICLEGYKEREELGTLDCGHDYHAGCIKKWLLIKNVCPICKAPALEDNS